MLSEFLGRCNNGSNSLYAVNWYANGARKAEASEWTRLLVVPDSPCIAPASMIYGQFCATGSEIPQEKTINNPRLSQLRKLLECHNLN
jgi:hypothetical protein